MFWRKPRIEGGRSRSGRKQTTSRPVWRKCLGRLHRFPDWSVNARSTVAKDYWITTSLSELSALSSLEGFPAMFQERYNIATPEEFSEHLSNRLKSKSQRIESRGSCLHASVGEKVGKGGRCEW